MKSDPTKRRLGRSVSIDGKARGRIQSTDGSEHPLGHPTPIDDALGAIIDGRDIDWERTLESSAQGGERRTLRALRVLSRVQDLTSAGEIAVPGRWGSLEVLEKIGVGGFASVYRALDPVLGLEVALKILHRHGTKAGSEILEEGRRLARVRHPNVVRIFGVEELSGRIGLRMELIRGHSLDRVVREDGPRGPIEATRIGLETCRALAAVHHAGLVHRDVKAQNVMQDEDGRVVLMDLGAGSESGAGEQPAASARGTPLYLAPELLDGAEATPGTDLYALGVLLFFLVSGRFPVEAGTLDLIREAHRELRITSLRTIRPDLPASLVQVVNRATHPDPAERFASVSEMARALAAALSARDDWSRQTSPAERARPAPGNLPPTFTRFVGRRADLEAVGKRLREHRLVTLVGPGGCGKTRLALEIGTSLHDVFDDGVWFVPLAPVRDAAGVSRVFGAVFGAQEVAGERFVHGIARSLGQRRVLVVVDNCEHVAAAVSGLVSELRTCTPSVAFVLTSRVALGVPGEVTHIVPPLAVRDLDDDSRELETLGSAVDEATVRQVSRNEAVELFVDRVRAVHPGFTVDASNARAIARICRGLDGLPLALELAAAQVRSVPLRELANRLRDRLDLLSSSMAVEPAHHRTLISSIAWSYDLLSHEGRAALRCLSVFAGGWTLEAAESVIPEATGIREREVLRVLSGLVSSSLVHLSGTEAFEHRYDMLDTVREFARQRLEEKGTRVVVVRAFVRHYLELSKRMNRALMGAGDVEAMRALRVEHDNIRAACRATIELSDLEVGLDLARHLGRFWMTGGFFTEGRRFCEELLNHPSAPDRTLDRAAVAGWFAVFAKLHRDTDLARERWEESLDIRRERNDRHGVASAMNGLGTLEYDAGRFEPARRLYDQSLRIRRELGEGRGIAQSLTNLGLCHAAEGDFELAVQRIDEARTIHESLGNAFGVAKTLGEIGFLRSRQGRHEEAIRLLDRAVQIQADLGPNISLLCRLGFAHLWAGSLDEARTAFENALHMFEGTAEPSLPSLALNGLALVEEKAGNLARAAQLLGAGAADVTRLRMGWEDEEVAGAEVRLRTALGDRDFEIEFATGRAATFGGWSPG